MPATRRKTYEVLGPRGRTKVKTTSSRRAIWHEYGGKNWLCHDRPNSGGWELYSHPLFNGQQTVNTKVAVRRLQ